MLIEVPLPNPCYEVHKVEKGKIYLKRKAQICPQVIVYKRLNLKEGEYKILIDGKVWKVLKVKPKNTP